MSAEAQLEALLEIINTSARQAIAEYKKGGNDVPTIHSKTFHPIDFAIDSVALKKAVRTLEGACQQLCASLAPPQHTLLNYSFSFEWACTHVVIRAKVADALEKFPEGLHVDELAKLVNLERGKLARILRLLATKGCFIEVSTNVFANNRISLATLSSSNHWQDARSRHITEDIFPAASVLYEVITEPEHATSYALDKSPLSFVLKKKGFNGNYFDWLKEDAERHDAFHHSMIWFGFVTGSLSVLHHYPWNEVKTVCDVGASIGIVSIPLSKMHPHLQIVNQDLPDVLAQAKDVWAKDAPEALQNNRIEFVPFNFLEESPVHGQDLYYLRHIVHDWPDTQAAIILSNVRKAMGPESRLLIHEYALTPVCGDPDAKSIGVDVAPDPLLPNFGNGNSRWYQVDIHMLLAFNSKERPLSDLVALGVSAGLRLEKVYDLAETAVLEFRLAAE